MEKLALHHIGGRNGSRPFPILEKFEADFVSVLYDADASCLDEARAKNSQLQSELIVLPYCVAQGQGQVQFHLNYDPFTSSVLEKNPHYDHFCLDTQDQAGRVVDYVYGEALQTVKKIPMQTVSLDHLFFEQKISAPLPDFLSIDTQGSEFEILTGANRTLENVLGVIAEVEFVQLYQGQKLFGDISAFMADKNFDFIDFVHLGKLRPAIAPIGLRGSGRICFGDALFLRRPQSVLTLTDPRQQEIQLKKLAFVAIVYGQIETALECLQLIQEQGFDLSPAQGPNYMRFLEKFSACISHYKLYPAKFRPPSISASADANSTMATTNSSPGRSLVAVLKSCLKKFPLLHQKVVQVYLQLREKRSKLRHLRHPSRYLPQGVELVLKEFGLLELAKEMKQRRLLY